MSRGDCDQRADRQMIVVIVTMPDDGVPLWFFNSQLDLSRSRCGHPDQLFDTRHDGYLLDREHEIYVLLHTNERSLLLCLLCVFFGQRADECRSHSQLLRTSSCQEWSLLLSSSRCEPYSSFRDRLGWLRGPGRHESRQQASKCVSSLHGVIVPVSDRLFRGLRHWPSLLLPTATPCQMYRSLLDVVSLCETGADSA